MIQPASPLRRNGKPASSQPSKPVSSLTEDAVALLGEDGPCLLGELREAFLTNPDAFVFSLPNVPPEKQFETWVRKLLKRVARLPSRHRRLAYIDTCLHRRIAQLVAWLENNSDPAEILDADEIREIPSEELRAFRAEISRSRAELGLDDESGLRLLAQRIGWEPALSVWRSLQKTFNPDKHEERIDAILRKAAHANVKHPVKYVRAVIANEGNGRRGKRKH